MKSVKNSFIKSHQLSEKNTKKRDKEIDTKIRLSTHGVYSMITIICPSRYKINRKSLKSSTVAKLESSGFAKTQFINIVLVGKKKMKDISTTYKNEQVALPVLSFVYNEEDADKRLLGEVLICYPQAVLLAARRGKKVDDMISDLALHGIDNIIKHLKDA